MWEKKKKEGRIFWAASPAQPAQPARRPLFFIISPTQQYFLFCEQPNNILYLNFLQNTAQPTSGYKIFSAGHRTEDNCQQLSLALARSRSPMLALALVDPGIEHEPCVK